MMNDEMKHDEPSEGAERDDRTAEECQRRPRDLSGLPEPPVRTNRESQAQASSEPAAELDGDKQDSKRATAAIGNESFTLEGDAIRSFENARKLCIAAQAVAIASLFFGGVYASAVAVGLAVAGHLKIRSVCDTVPNERAKATLKRAGVIAIAVSALTLVLNTISAIAMYPMVLEAVQTGNFDSLLGSGASGSASSGTSSTWG